MNELHKTTQLVAEEEYFYDHWDYFFFYLNSKCTELYLSSLGEYVRYQIQQGILLLIPGPHNILIYIPRLPLDIRSVFSQASGIYLHLKSYNCFSSQNIQNIPPVTPRYPLSILASEQGHVEATCAPYSHWRSITKKKEKEKESLKNSLEIHNK